MGLSNLLTSGVSAIDVTSQRVEATGNDIVNVETIGYKRSIVITTEAFNNTLNSASPSPGGTTPGSNTTPNQIGLGVKLKAITKDFSQGSVKLTGVRSHLAIESRGFFKVKDSINTVEFATRGLIEPQTEQLAALRRILG